MHISDTSTRTRTAFALHAVCGALLILSSLPATAASTLDKVAKSGVVSLGYRDNSLPFSYLNADKRPIGYSIDICLKIVDALKREIKRNDLNVKYVKVTTETRLKSLESGEIDLECGSTNASAERRKLADFTIPTYIASTRLLVKSDSGIKSVYDLAGKTVVMTKGTTQEKLFAEINKNHTLRAKTVLGNTHDESFALLEAGKADAFMLNDILLASVRSTSKTPDRYVLTRDPLTIDPLSLTLRKNDDAFRKIVTGEIHRLITQGEINGMYRKWFESPIPPNQVNLKLPMSYLLRDSFKSPTEWLP
ncbi:MAG: amino acid ABC transporter substrate-binding protein [Propionivibrio sp.]